MKQWYKCSGNNQSLFDLFDLILYPFHDMDTMTGTANDATNLRLGKAWTQEKAYYYFYTKSTKIYNYF